MGAWKVTTPISRASQTCSEVMSLYPSSILGLAPIRAVSRKGNSSAAPQPPRVQMMPSTSGSA